MIINIKDCLRLLTFNHLRFTFRILINLKPTVVKDTPTLSVTEMSAKNLAF